MEALREFFSSVAQPKRRTHKALLTALLVVFGFAAVVLIAPRAWALDACYTGSWYDPAAPGEGVSVEVLDDTVLVYFYRGDGEWFALQGDDAGLTAYQPWAGQVIEVGSGMSIERTVIATLLSGGWPYGGYLLAEHDFTEKRHRRIFRAIADEAKDGGTPDLLIVRDRLKENLSDFVNEVGSVRNMTAYVEQLKDATLHRQLGETARAILASEGSGRERLIEAQSLLASLHTGVAGEVVAVADAVAGWWDELGERANSDSWLHTGFADVDKRLGGMRAGDLIIIAGRPSMGKTALGLNIATGCRKHCAFFSLEMSRHSILDRLAAGYANVPLGHVRSPNDMTSEEWERVTQASAKIRQLPLYVDDTAGLTMEEIHARARSLKPKGLDLIVVDYLQFIEGDRKLSREQQVAQISRAGKRMAKDLQVPVILLAQLSRKCEERQDKRPLMSDLRDSGSIEQDADAIAFVYRDEQYNENSQHKGYAELIWRKVRQGEVGTDWFVFDGAHQRFLPAVKPPEAPAPIKRGPYSQPQPHWVWRLWALRTT